MIVVLLWAAGTTICTATSSENNGDSNSCVVVKRYKCKLTIWFYYSKSVSTFFCNDKNA